MDVVFSESLRFPLELLHHLLHLVRIDLLIALLASPVCAHVESVQWQHDSVTTLPSLSPSAVETEDGGGVSAELRRVAAPRTLAHKTFVLVKIQPPCPGSVDWSNIIILRENGQNPDSSGSKNSKNQNNQNNDTISYKKAQKYYLCDHCEG